MNFKRIILKLSGESLANSNGFGANKLSIFSGGAGEDVKEKMLRRIYGF